MKHAFFDNSRLGPRHPKPSPEKLERPYKKLSQNALNIDNDESAPKCNLCDEPATNMEFVLCAHHVEIATLNEQLQRRDA
jgi:hypothetical protein